MLFFGRCGSIQPGDKLLAINDVKTENMLVEDALHLLQSTDDIIKLRLKRDDPYSGKISVFCSLLRGMKKKKKKSNKMNKSKTFKPG